MKNTQKTLSPVRFYREFKVVAIFSLVLASASCTTMERQADNFVDFYKENGPIQAKSYMGDEAVAFGTHGFGPLDEFDITSGNGGVRMGKKYALPNEEIEKGLAFQQSEERRNKLKYLTMR